MISFIRLVINKIRRPYFYGVFYGRKTSMVVISWDQFYLLSPREGGVLLGKKWWHAVVLKPHPISFETRHNDHYKVSPVSKSKNQYSRVL